MKLFPEELEIRLYEEGFGDEDLLGRAKVGKALSSLVERIEDPLVIALDGKWGTGKTHFLKRWVGAHQLENDGTAKTVYFDAFSNDFITDPLPALVSVVSDRFDTDRQDLFRQMKAAAFALAKPAARLGLAMASLGATEVLSAAGDTAVEAIEGEASMALDAYWSRESERRAAVAKFRQVLSQFVSQIEADMEEGSPHLGAKLVVVVDELDRCRPDYALEVLEITKHLFEVPGVVFVFGTNISALENTVRVRYGAEIDARAYLEKFFSTRISLPHEVVFRSNATNVNEIYLDHQFQRMGIANHLHRLLQDHIEIVSKRNFISIRDLNKILVSTALLGGGALEGDRFYDGNLNILVSLLVARIINLDMYDRLVSLTFSQEDFFDYFSIDRDILIKNSNSQQISEYMINIERLYNDWMYIKGTDGGDGVLTEDSASISWRFGRVRQVASIPKRLQRECLDVFTMTQV